MPSRMKSIRQISYGKFSSYHEQWVWQSSYPIVCLCNYWMNLFDTGGGGRKCDPRQHASAWSAGQKLPPWLFVYPNVSLVTPSIPVNRFFSSTETSPPPPLTVPSTASHLPPDTRGLEQLCHISSLLWRGSVGAAHVITDPCNWRRNLEHYALVDEMYYLGGYTFGCVLLCHRFVAPLPQYELLPTCLAPLICKSLFILHSVICNPSCQVSSQLYKPYALLSLVLGDPFQMETSPLFLVEACYMRRDHRLMTLHPISCLSLQLYWLFKCCKSLLVAVRFTSIWISIVSFKHYIR